MARFSKVNQPLKKGKNEGKKIGSIYLSEFVFRNQDYTKVPLSKMFEFFQEMLWMKEKSLKDMAGSEEVPTVLRTFAGGLTGEKRFIYTQQVIELIIKYDAILQEKELLTKEIELPKITFI